MPSTPSLLEDPRLAEYARHLRRADLSPTTVRGYLHDLQLFLRWWQDLRPRARLEQLSDREITDYRERLMDEQRARASTVNRRLESLRRFCGWARQERILKKDVTISTKPVRMVRRRRPPGLDAGESKALLRAAAASRASLAPRNVALVEMLLHTGLRVDELAALCRGDVTLRDRSGLVRVRRGKGRKEREVPLNTAGRRALRRYDEARGESEAEAPLFATPRGGAMSVRAIQYTVSELARRAGISRLAVSPQLLRHTFSHNFLRANPGKIEQLAALLGHESLDTTAIYTRPSNDELTEGLERLADTFQR